MSGPLYLVWRYVVHHRIKTGLLIASISLIMFLPVGLNVLVSESADELMARADATPLLLGARTSSLELVLSSLYFESRAPEPTTWSEVERLEATGLAHAIPLHVGFRARGHAIVGTSLDYFEQRELDFAAGRAMAVLGECVLGAAAARRLELGIGDTLVSSPETVFDLAGVYPLELRVVGVLEPAHTADDRAVFTDVKTTWVIAGLGHGHGDLGSPEAQANVLTRDGERITANAAVVEYTSITAENLGSFHFHGDVSTHPITAAIAVPPDPKSRVLLLGRYQGAEDPVQLAQPSSVIADLLGTVFTVRRYVVAAIAGVGVATGITASLVFALSVRLRRRELETLVKIGAARSHVAGLLAGEVVLVLVAGVALASGLTLLTRQLGSAAIRTFLVL